MNDDSDVWRAVPGYEGQYDVSRDGRVRRTPRVIKQRLTPHGYLRLGLYLDGEQSSKHVHQLVALAFLGPRPDGQEVRHLDGDRLNNHADNLKYGTRTENMQDSLRHGTNRNARKTHCKRGHPFEGDNLVVGPRGHRRCRTCIRAQNRARRGYQGGPPNALKTHCKRGHELTPENSYARPDGLGKRQCRACKRENDQRARDRKNLAA